MWVALLLLLLLLKKKKKNFLCMVFCPCPRHVTIYILVILLMPLKKD